MSHVPNRSSANAAHCLRCILAYVVLFLISFFASATGATAESAEEPSSDSVQQPTVSEEITVAANRIETPIDEVGSSISVLDRSDIERHAWSTVADALRSMPGLEVSRSGGVGQLTSVFVRGGSSSQVLVLIDGVRLNSATSGAYDFSAMTTDAIERIEVVRGPQSTLYGSEAVAGVISIVTDRSESERVHVTGRVEGGDDDHHRLELSVGARRGSFDYRISLADHHTEDASAADARRGNPEVDAWSNTTATARFGWALGGGEMGRFDVDLRHVDSDVEIDGFSFSEGAVDDLDARNLRTARIGSVTLELTPTDRWTQTVRLGVSDDELQGEDPTNPFGNFIVESETLQASTRTDLRLEAQNVDHTLSFGAEWESRDGGSVGSFSDEAEIASFYLQDRLSVGRLHLTLGARYDDHDQFGDETTWRAAAALGVGTSGRLRASWGTGFKAPTLNDLFFPGFGNPDLVPETSEGFDLGYEHRFGDRWRLDLTGFDLDFENLIAFDFATFLPQNIASASSTGVEVQVAYEGERSRLVAHHTWNETEDEATGSQLARRPEHRSVMDLSWRVTDSWNVATRLVAVADRIDSDGSELEDYERLDLTVEYAVTERWRPYVRLINVLDEEYSEVGGFGTQGATALVGLRLAR
ncbi:MAG: TonB-dependent receptor [Thermoanaerobaculia bacterium]|nr:TonB-dependent receptor [Thermoanaerobaculia bacterium]